MVDPSPFFSLINEETARLKWFEAFMRRRYPVLFRGLVTLTKSVIRVELEQQTYADSNRVHKPGTDYPERISGLQWLLEWAPPLPEQKLLWHRTLETLLEGTRNGSNPMVDN